MSHERSPPPSPRTEGFTPSTSTSQQFAKSHSALTGAHVPLTLLEQLCVGRSDSSFNALAGAAGGFTSGVVTCPLDVIKTKLQAQGGFRAQQAHNGETPAKLVYRGMLGTARVIWLEDGIRGMYRGLGPMILGYLPTWAVWFTVYGRAKNFFFQYHDNPNVVNFLSSIIAGGSSTMVTNPIWVIKTRLMSQISSTSKNGHPKTPWQYTSTLDAARKMYKTEGILSFYSGLTPALLGLTHVAVQFPAYEFLRRKFTGKGMGVTAEGDTKSHFAGVLSASVLSKILASSATYPHEVIRTRLQTQQRSAPSASVEYAAFRGGLEGSEHTPGTIVTKANAVTPRYKGIVTTFKTILREEGWRAFYAGMGTNMMRAVPAAATTMLTYEIIIRQLNSARASGMQKSTTEW